MEIAAEETTAETTAETAEELLRRLRRLLLRRLLRGVKREVHRVVVAIGCVRDTRRSCTRKFGVLHVTASRWEELRTRLPLSRL